MGKPSKKKISRKKTTHHGKNKKLSRRKMKGGVAFNTPFFTSSLPSSSYIPLNPDVNNNPSWNQIDSRLLPAMKGGKKTRKKRGGEKNPDTRFNRMKRFLKRSSMNAVGLKSKNQIAEEKQAKIEEIKKDLETNYDKVTANELMNRLDDNDSALDDEKRAKNDFYTYDEKKNYEEIEHLGKIESIDMIVDWDLIENASDFIDNLDKKIAINRPIIDHLIATGEWQGDGQYVLFKIGGWEKRRKVCQIGRMRYLEKCLDKFEPWKNAVPPINTDAPIFYIKKAKGGKKARKSRRKRKMKGGSLVGTDIVTGLNTTESNNVMAFGTTGGTDFMKDTILAKGIDSGPYLSEKTVPDPMLV